MRVRTPSAWLWLLVALQIAIPASYYLVRQDRDDERFAWRMFSAVRLKRCSVRAFDRDDVGTAQPVELSHALHASWVRSLERGRRRVVTRFLATRCGAPSVSSALLERRCQWPSQRPLPPEQYLYDCATGALEVTR